MRVTNIPDFSKSQLSLLSAELRAETASTTLLLSSTSPKLLAGAGLAILNLNLSSLRTGFGGKTVLELEKDHAVGNDGELGEHGIRVGDIVKVGEQPKGGEKKKDRASLDGSGTEGVVIRIGAKGLQVALEDGNGAEEALSGRLWVVKLANDITYKRMKQTMERLEKMEERDYSILTRVLFGIESVASVSEDSADWPKEVVFFDSTLNDSQKDAVRFALASREVALIHGPPGTGKTYTLIELIRQLVHRNLRVLVCGPSNISVDNIVERLAPHRLPILRLGHPARLLPSVLDHSLDILAQTSDAASIVKDVRKEMDAKQASIKKTRNGRERRAIYGELKELRKEYREREKKCVNLLVGGSKVVLATLHGAGGFQLRNEVFDVVIIDEASQALEAQCWVPLLSAKKVVLAGDHLQLPPTIKSSASDQKEGISSNRNISNDGKGTPSKDNPSIGPDDKTQSLEITLFDRLLTLHGPKIKRMLTTQYRMHELIMRFPSAEMYENRLIAAPSVSQRLLATLTYPVQATDDTRESLIYYDTQGGDFPENDSADSSRSDTEGSGSTPSRSSLLNDSKSNPMEAALAARHVSALIDAGVRESDIAVITPYNAQLSLLSALLRHKYPVVELGSVDGFQGREKEAVVLSLVRSNADEKRKAEVGFLGEKRRLNVAMTRPRRQLCVIGDAETVGRGSDFLKRWIEFLEAEADLRYLDVAELQGMDAS